MRDALLSLAVGGLAMVAAGSASAATIPTSFGAGADALINLGTSSNVNKGGNVNGGVQNVEGPQ